MKKCFYHITTLLLVFFVSFQDVSAQKLKRHKPLKKRHKPANFVNSYSLINGAGLGTYYGDLCDNFDCFRFRPFIANGFQYRLNGSVSFRSEITWTRLFGTDEGGPNANRNLHFRADNFEINALVVYDIFEFDRMHLKRYKYSPYLFMGFGFLNLNPKAQYEGEWYNLRKLQTEGVEYSAFAFVLPYGGGVRYQVSPHLSIHFELSYRWTFTDYLDDVSTTYVDNSTLSGISATLADRTKEGGFNIWDSNDGGNTWAAGKQRGNPTKNDGYLLFGFKSSYVLKITKQHYNINSNRAKFRIIKSIKRKR